MFYPTNNTVDKIIGRDTGTNIESQLDIQMMGILVPNADLWFWTENNWLYSMAVELFYSKNIPDVISMGWGWAEDEQCSILKCSNETSKQYVDRVNTEYMKLGLRGMSILVSVIPIQPSEALIICFSVSWISFPCFF